MRGLMKGMLVVGLVLGAFVAMGTAASADQVTTSEPVVIEPDVTQQYRAAMDYFVPELGRWAAELEGTFEALSVKPEVAADLPEIAYRGKLLVFDLEGTAAPRELAGSHETMVFAMGQLTEAAQIAVDDPDGAELLMSRYLDRLNDARQEIRAWLTATQVIELGQTPAKLVAGN